jgi:hypothetical protein
MPIVNLLLLSALSLPLSAHAASSINAVPLPGIETFTRSKNDWYFTSRLRDDLSALRSLGEVLRNDIAIGRLSLVKRSAASSKR